MHKTQPDITLKRAFSIAEAAEYAAVSRGTVMGWIQSGLLPYEDLPTTGTKNRLRRIRKTDLDAFLDSCYTGKTPKDSATKPTIINHSLSGDDEVFLLPKRA